MTTSQPLCTLIYALGLVASVWVGGEAYKLGNIERQRAETIRAQYYVTASHYEAEKARFESITEYIQLEAKRTTVQSEIKKVVMAEYKRCRKVKC